MKLGIIITKGRDNVWSHSLFGRDAHTLEGARVIVLAVEAYAKRLRQEYADGVSDDANHIARGCRKPEDAHYVENRPKDAALLRQLEGGKE